MPVDCLNKPGHTTQAYNCIARPSFALIRFDQIMVYGLSDYLIITNVDGLPSDLHPTARRSGHAQIDLICLLKFFSLSSHQNDKRHAHIIMLKETMMPISSC